MLKEFKLNENVVLRNRIVVAPMVTWAANDDLTVSKAEAEYYSARSKGAGMVITGCTFFEPNGQVFEKEFYAGSDEYIPSLRLLSNSIKSQGAKAILQIYHGGRLAIPGKGPLMSASAVKPTYNAYRMKVEMEEPKEMTYDEIHNFIKGFYNTIRRAIEAGFDGIEIHGANAHLIQQFFSGESNRRTDDWGGSREKRLKLPLEIIKAANKAKQEFASDDFIIGYRLSPEETEENGITLDDTLFLVDRLADEPIDYLHVALYHYKSTSERDSNDKRIIGKLLSDKINGRKPLIGVGSILSKEDAEDALQNVGYDMIALGRIMVTDPDWVYKIANDLKVETAIDLDNYQEKKIPEGLINVIKSVPGWFEVK